MPGEEKSGNLREPEARPQGPLPAPPVVKVLNALTQADMAVAQPNAPVEPDDDAVDLTVIIPALNEGPNIALLLPSLRDILEHTVARWEILIVTGGADQRTLDAAANSGALVLEQIERGYGGALLPGLAHAPGPYVLTMD